MKKIDGLYKTIDNPSKLHQENKRRWGKKKREHSPQRDSSIPICTKSTPFSFGNWFRVSIQIIYNNKKHKSKGNQKTKITKQPMVQNLQQSLNKRLGVQSIREMKKWGSWRGERDREVDKEVAERNSRGEREHQKSKQPRGEREN